MTIWRMRIACRVPNFKNAHSEYVILVACPLQQWFYEHALMLRYKHIARLLCCQTR
jgi:hypothetical protein